MNYQESHRRRHSYTSAENITDAERYKPSYVLIENGQYTHDRTKPDVPYSLVGRKVGSMWDCTVIFEILDAEDVSFVGVEVEEQLWKNVDLVPGLPDVIQRYFDPLYQPDETVMRHVESIWTQSVKTGQTFADVLYQDDVIS